MKKLILLLAIGAAPVLFAQEKSQAKFGTAAETKAATVEADRQAKLEAMEAEKQKISPAKKDKKASTDVMDRRAKKEQIMEKKAGKIESDGRAIKK